MSYHPFRSICRLVLAVTAASVVSASVSAQTAPSTTAPSGPNPSRVDIFMGYSYWGAHGQLKPAGISYSSIDLGAIGSGAYYLNKWVGGEIIYVNHPSGNNDGMSSISAGPIFRLPLQDFTVFAHGLAGAARLGGPNNTAAFSYHNPYTWGPSLTAGGGMDYNLPFWNGLLGIRLFEADYKYIHANFGPFTPPPTGGPMGGRANLNSVELSTGLLLHFGHVIPPPPVTLSCSVSPTSVFPGDPITVTGTPMNLNPKRTATFNWTVDNGGGAISGTGSTAQINTSTAAPGTYTVKGHVSQGVKPGDMADCSASYTVKQFEPPTISCSANPSTINPGDSSTITSVGNSPQNRPLTYSYSSSAGSVTGNGTTATLSTAGAAPGTITVTCNVVDDKGQQASATTTVTVNAPPPPPAPTTSSLCSLDFTRDKNRPTRVDNEAKACLDDIALNLQRDSTAKLALLGNASQKERDAFAKAQKRKTRTPPVDPAAARAVNAKDYLVTEKGIDASRISVFTGTTDAQTVTTTLIPNGASFSAPGTSVDESAVKAQPRKPLPTRRR